MNFIPTVAVTVCLSDDPEMRRFQIFFSQRGGEGGWLKQKHILMEFNQCLELLSMGSYIPQLLTRFHR